MSNQSKFFEKPLVELMPDEDSLKKLEFLATHSAYSLGFESTLRDAVDSLFIEYALDESFNSDEP